MYQLLVTLTFQEHGNNALSMTTNTLSFDSIVKADTAYRQLQNYFPRNAIYADVVKLYIDIPNDSYI